MEFIFFFFLCGYVKSMDMHSLDYHSVYLFFFILYVYLVLPPILPSIIRSTSTSEPLTLDLRHLDLALSHEP